MITQQQSSMLVTRWVLGLLCLGWSSFAWAASPTSRPATSRPTSKPPTQRQAPKLKPPATPTRIGIVDFHQAMKQTKAHKKLRQKLRSMSQNYRKIVKVFKKRLRQQRRRYLQARPYLSPQERKTAAQKLHQQTNKLRALLKKLASQLASMERKETRKLFKQFQPLLAKLRRKYKLDLVLDKRGDLVLSLHNALDYTPQLIQLYQNQHDTNATSRPTSRPARRSKPRSTPSKTTPRPTPKPTPKKPRPRPKPKADDILSPVGDSEEGNPLEE